MNDIIRGIYVAMTGCFGILLLRGLFRRRARRSVAYDIVYAYTIIPFLLRVLQVK